MNISWISLLFFFPILNFILVLIILNNKRLIIIIFLLIFLLVLLGPNIDIILRLDLRLIINITIILIHILSNSPLPLDLPLGQCPSIKNIDILFQLVQQKLSILKIEFTHLQTKFPQLSLCLLHQLVKLLLSFISTHCPYKGYVCLERGQFLDAHF